MIFNPPILVRFRYGGKDLRGVAVSLDTSSLSIISGDGTLRRINLLDVGSVAGIGPVTIDPDNKSPLGLCLPCQYSDPFETEYKAATLVCDFAPGPVVVDSVSLSFELADGVLVDIEATETLFSKAQ